MSEIEPKSDVCKASLSHQTWFLLLQNSLIQEDEKLHISALLNVMVSFLFFLSFFILFYFIFLVGSHLDGLRAYLMTLCLEITPGCA